MRTIQCKKLGSVTSLTVGNSYNIIEESEDRFTIVNDKGIQARYGKNLFNDPIEEQAEVPAPRRGPGRPRNAAPAQRPAPVPAPARVIPAIDQIEVVTSATNDGGIVSFKANFTFLPGRVFQHLTGETIYTSDTASSCGIKSLNGLNDLSNNVASMRNAFNNYVRDNSQHFTLSQNIDVEALFEEVSTAWIQDLIATFQGEDADIRAGILILSTTESFIERHPNMRRALNNASANNLAVHNPNSGNDIVMWNIAVEA